MDKVELIPDVLDTVPKTVLTVNFKGDTKVTLGNNLAIQQVSEQPIQIDWEAQPEKFYTLCFTDPDAPSRAEPKVREWVHWLVVNIPGSSKNLSAGETLIEFVPSCPGEGSGEHRYTFVVYEQPSKLDFSGETKLNRSADHRAPRRNFSIRNFGKKYAMREPAHAGNFYITQWDSYVAVIRKQLGLE